MNLRNNLHQINPDTKEYIHYSIHIMFEKITKTKWFFLRDAYRGGKNYKEKQRIDYYKIRLVINIKSRCEREDCDHEGHAMGFWSPDNF